MDEALDLRLAFLVRPLHDKLKGRMPTREELREVSEEYGIDAASVFFARSALTSPLHSHFIKAMEMRPANASIFSPRSASPQIEIVYVPSSNYGGLPWGAWFHRLLKYSEQRGLVFSRAPTRKGLSVLTNSQIISEHLASRPQDSQKIILSHGQGSAEVRLMTAQGRKLAQAWLSVAGSCQGYALGASLQRNWVRRQITRLSCLRKGWNAEAIQQLAELLPRLEKTDENVHQLQVFMVPVALAANCSKVQARTMERLAKMGPNDGFNLLTDMHLKPGIIYPALGLTSLSPLLRWEPSIFRALDLIGDALTNAKNSREQDLSVLYNDPDPEVKLQLWQADWKSREEQLAKSRERRRALSASSADLPLSQEVLSEKEETFQFFNT